MSEMADVEASKSQPPTDVAAAEVPPKPSGTRRLVHVLGAILIVLVLPALLMGVFIGTLGVWALINGLVIGVAGSKIGGTRRMLLVAPVLGVAAGLAAFTAYDW